jgi:hypothetical protein
MNPHRGNQGPRNLGDRVKCVERKPLYKIGPTRHSAMDISRAICHYIPLVFDWQDDHNCVQDQSCFLQNRAAVGNLFSPVKSSSRSFKKQGSLKYLLFGIKIIIDELKRYRSVGRTKHRVRRQIGMERHAQPSPRRIISIPFL